MFYEERKIDCFDKDGNLLFVPNRWDDETYRFYQFEN